MQQDGNDRRTFLRLLSAGALTGALAASSGEETHADTPKRAFTGVSKKGDIMEALQNAIAAAERSVRHPDAMVDWTLRGVSGRSGGIAGFREVRVTIDARVS